MSASQFPTSFQPDLPLIIDALYRSTNADRSYIDSQIRGLQQILGGVIGGSVPISQSAIETMAGADHTVASVLNTAVRITTGNGHSLFMPPAPNPGQTVLAMIEDTSLTSGNVTLNGNGKNIQYNTAPAATYVLSKANGWNDYSTATCVYNGTFWKVS